MGLRSGEKAPAFDVRGANLLDYEHRAHTWMGATRTELTARASLLALHMQLAPRQVCPAEGSDTSDHGDGAPRILEISRSYFAPEAADAIR